MLQIYTENNRCVSKVHIRQTRGGVKTMCNIPPPSKATFLSLTACLYRPHLRDPEWCLRQASKRNLGLLWPWPFTSWPSRSTVRALPPRKDLCHSRSIKVIRNYTDKWGVCKVLLVILILGLNICLTYTVNDIFNVEFWRDLEMRVVKGH